MHSAETLQTSGSDTASYLLQLFLNNTDNGFILTDRSFNIVFFNKLADSWALQFVGTPLRKGMPLFELSDEERRQEQVELLQQTLNGIHHEFEYSIPLAEKDYVCFHNAFHPARNNDGDIVGVLVTSKDITETKKKTEALKISNERYELISQATSDATWDYDLVSGDVQWNESLKKFFGHNYSQDISGYELWEKHIHPDDKVAVVNGLETAVKTGAEHWDGEYRFIKEDGTIVYVYDRGMIVRNDEGVPVRMIGSMQDITRQKEAEAKIAASEHWFRSLVQTGNDLIGIVDKNGYYLYVSPSVKQLGYAPEQLIGKNCFGFIHQDDVQTCQDALSNVFSTHQIKMPLTRFKAANGEWRWMETIISNLLDDEAVGGVVVNSSDVTERKAKDEALQNALNDLNKVLDSSVDVIVVTDEQNRYVKVSAASEVVWGYSPEELIGRNCAELIHPEDRVKTALATTEVIEGARLTNFQNRYIRKDGTVVPLMWSAKWDEEQKVMYSIARDASEKQKSEAALIESEKRYKDLFENSPLPMFAYDVNDYSLVMVNDALAHRSKYSKEELLTKTLFQMKAPEEAERLRQFLQTVNKSDGIRNAGEWKFLSKDGEAIEVEIISHSITIQGRECRLVAVHDLTERNKARAALQKSEAMFRAISENFPNGIVAILNRDMNFVYAAGNELPSLGIKPEYFIGTHYLRHFNDEDGNILRLSKKVFKGESVVSEIRLFERNYLLSSVPLHEADGSITRMLVVAQNITSQKKVQKEKELLIEELNKTISDLKQFSYITSHNLRSPICNLMGIMDLIEMNKIEDENTFMLVEKFKESTYLLNDTVNDLLNVLLIKNNVNIKREVLNIDGVWKDVCTSVNSIINDSSARITADFTCGTEVEFNKSYAESVLLNLLTNAIKYRSPKRQLHIELRTKQTGDYLLLEFSDNGIGINMERHRHKIFGLYQRFHNYSDSKGLGLYIVHSQITALGGKIEVDSAEDKGTCFKVYFKRRRNDAE